MLVYVRPFAVAAAVAVLVAIALFPRGDGREAFPLVAGEQAMDSSNDTITDPAVDDSVESSPGADTTDLSISERPAPPLPPSDAQLSPPSDPPSTATALMVGDSVFLELALGFEQPTETPAGTELTLTADVRLGCGTLQYGLNPDCVDRIESWEGSVADDEPDVVVIGVSSWDALDIDLDGRYVELASQAHNQVIIDSWNENLDVLTASGAPVLVVGLPCLAFPDTDSGVDDEDGEEMDGTVPQRVRPGRTLYVNRVVKDVVEKYDGDVEWLEIRNLTCPEGQYQSTVDGVPLHRDGIHLTPEAVPLVWDWLLPYTDAALVS